MLAVTQPNPLQPAVAAVADDERIVVERQPGWVVELPRSLAAATDDPPQLALRREDLQPAAAAVGDDQVAVWQREQVAGHLELAGFEPVAAKAGEVLKAALLRALARVRVDAAQRWLPCALLAEERSPDAEAER